MVNTKRISTKNRILTRLRSLSGEAVSGEYFAAELGLSRVAVWKAVSALREAGYGIEASEEGYLLAPDAPDDFLYPWEFGEREGAFRHYAETTSTMDRARELSAKGVPAGTVVVAERQSEGKGRAGRSWTSEPGGLFFTMTLQAGAPLLRSARVACAAQLAVCAALRRAVGAEARPRWPNDAYSGGRKIAGVLVELEARGDAVTRLSLGVGVNVNSRPEGAISCADIAGRRISRREVLEAFLVAFEAERPYEDEALEARWNAAAEGVGARAAILDGRHGEEASANGIRLGEGTFEGIDELGRAMIRTDDGLRVYEAGTASLRFGSL